MDKQQLISAIVDREWNQFNLVQNEGGRASCQDDRPTFDIMRKSQFMTWNEAMLQSYEQDLIRAEAEGWNLLAEKYARMMQSTAPQQYEVLKDSLPFRSEQRLAAQEKILARQVKWLEEVYAKFPRIAGKGRPVHTSEDTEWGTSFETYQRGELSTYSDDTLELYIKFVQDMEAKGENYALKTLENTARLYGYKGLGEV